MKNPPETLAAIYRAWLAGKGLNAKDAAPLVGLAPSTSYEYASGLSVPADTKVADFARKIGRDPAALAVIVEADRPRCRRRKSRLHAPTRTARSRA